jgi:hypothetical protein
MERFRLDDIADADVFGVLYGKGDTVDSCVESQAYRSELSGGADTLTIDGVSAEMAGREAARRTTPAKDAINERFFMMFLPRKVKKLKRLIGRLVVHSQHRGAGGNPVHFFGATANHIGRASWPTSQVEQELLAKPGRWQSASPASAPPYS